MARCSSGICGQETSPPSLLTIRSLHTILLGVFISEISLVVAGKGIEGLFASSFPSADVYCWQRYVALQSFVWVVRKRERDSLRLTFADSVIKVYTSDSSAMQNGAANGQSNDHAHTNGIGSSAQQDA
jgi:hypothetical protein